MELTCPSCQKSVRVPAEPQPTPGRRAKCIHCRTSFEVAAAAPAPPSPPRTTGKVATLAAAGRAAAAEDPTVMMVPQAKGPDLTPQAGVADPPPGPPPAEAPPSRPRRTTGRTPVLNRSSGSIPVPSRPTGSSKILKPWGTCALHPGETSLDFCENCNAGCCVNCTKPMGAGKCCVTCLHPVIPAAEKRKAAEKDALRARPLFDELGRIVRYPISDPMGFGMLCFLVAFFNAARGVGMGMQVSGFAYIFSQGLMMGYAFTALRRVSHGNLTAGMPDMASLDDFVQPVRLAAASYLIAMLPFILVLFTTGFSLLNMVASAAHKARAPRAKVTKKYTPPPSAIPIATESDDEGKDPNELLQELADQAAAAQASGTPMEDPEPEPEPEPEASGGSAVAGIVLGTLSLIWALGYFPVAFMVAAISQSVWSTLDPREGLRAISAMGQTYWHAVGVTTALFVGCGLVRALVGVHPLTGFVLGPVVECYQWLAVGCVLGLAIFKRAEALGFD